MRTVEESNNIYGLKPTTDRIARLLIRPDKCLRECNEHIARKKRQIRQRRHELGLEGQNPVEYVKDTVAVRDIRAAMQSMEG